MGPENRRSSEVAPGTTGGAISVWSLSPGSVIDPAGTALSRATALPPPRNLAKDTGKDEWGAVLTGPEVARLPKVLRGIQITITAASGKSWTGYIEEVVPTSSEDDLVVVRYSRDGAD